MRRFVLLIFLIAGMVRAEPLAGTAPLANEGDLAMQMVEGIDKFLLRETAESVAKREQYWKRDLTSAEKYQA